jgi:heme O synthase-like polyprenyltransferase
MTDEENNTSGADCIDGNVLSRVGCILSYSGSSIDMSINYTLLVINLVWCIVALSLHTKDIDRSAALRTFALSALVFGTYYLMYIHVAPGLSIQHMYIY